MSAKRYRWTLRHIQQAAKCQQTIVDALGRPVCDAIEECHRSGEPLSNLLRAAEEKGANLATQLAITNYWNLLTVSEIGFPRK